MEEEQKFQVSFSDIVYKISINNKEVERNEKIVILTTKKMREILKDINISNYFIDIIYKIIPYRQKPYKLMTISVVNENTNVTNICCLLGVVYEDYLNLYYIFKYVSNFFHFNQKIVNIDFSSAERKALMQADLLLKNKLL